MSERDYPSYDDIMGEFRYIKKFEKSLEFLNDEIRKFLSSDYRIYDVQILSDKINSIGIYLFVEYECDVKKIRSRENNIIQFLKKKIVSKINDINVSVKLFVVSRDVINRDFKGSHFLFMKG